MSHDREVTVFASAARAATANSSSIANQDGYRGVVLTLDITAASGTAPTLDVKIQRYDAESGKWVDLTGAAFAQKTATGTSDLTIYPSIAETANVSVSDVLGAVWRAVATIAGTTPSFTFSLGACYVP
jgi:hypothetical protein